MTFEELRAAAKKNAADRTKAADQKPLGTSLRNYETGIDTTRTSYPSQSKKTAAASSSPPTKTPESTEATVRKKAPKNAVLPVRKDPAPVTTKAPRSVKPAEKATRRTVQADPASYGYDPMVADDLQRRHAQTSAMKATAKPFSAGKLLGDTAMQGMNRFAGFFSSGLAMAEDAGGYAAGLLTGQPGVNLAEGGIFNTWDQAIKREGQAMEQSAAENIARGGKAAETVYKYGTDTVAAVPQAVLAMLTGGGSALASSAGLAQTAANALSPSLSRTISNAVAGMAKNPQYWTSFAQVVGPGYQQAVSDGADPARAALYAVGNGILNAAVEIGGGLQRLPGALRGGTQVWKAVVDSMLEEGQEEVVQGVIERAMQNLVYNQKNQLASPEDPRAVLNPRTALEEFKGGAVVGGLLGGGQAAVQAGINAHAQSQIQKQLDLMERTAREARERHAPQLPGAEQGGVSGRSYGARNPAADVQPDNSRHASERLQHGEPGPEFAPAPESSRQNAPIVDEIVQRAGDGTSSQTSHNAIDKRLARIDRNLFGQDGKLSAPPDSIVPGRSSDLSVIRQEAVDRARGILNAAGPAPASPLEAKAFSGRVLGYIRHIAGKGRGIQIPNADYTVDVGPALLERIVNSENLSPELLALVESLPSVLQRNTWTDSNLVNGRRVDSYLAPVRIGNDLYDVTFDVLVSRDGTVGNVRNLKITPTQNPYIRSAPAPQPYGKHVDSLFELIQKIQQEQTGSPQQEQQTKEPRQTSWLEYVPEDQAAAPNPDGQKLDAPPLPEFLERDLERREQAAARETVRETLSRGTRVDYDRFSPEQQAAVDSAYEQGTVGMDAQNRVFQIDPERHIDRRESFEAGDRKLNAFQFDHPELHRFYADAAQGLLSDLGATQKGGQIESAPGVMSDGVTPSSHNRYWRTSRSTSPAIAYLLDSEGMSYARIEKALNAILHDMGQENYADAKRVELVLDDMLSNGYEDVEGRPIPGVPEYVEAKKRIAGSQTEETTVSTEAEELPFTPLYQPPVEKTAPLTADSGAPGTDGLGAADAGFTTRQFQGKEQVSRMAKEQPYSRQAGEATGMTKEEYSRIFQYEAQTEAKTSAIAEELLYFQKDGHPVFLKDLDPVGYQELTDLLRESPAWTAEQMDAGRMILTELYGRSLNMEIEETEFSDWLSTVRQHETAAGQAVQAISKWVRGDNARGQRTVDAAIQSIQENPNLSENQKKQKLKDVIEFTSQINELDESQSLNLRDIILDIAERRGVLTGLTGVFGQTQGSIQRGRALFGRAMEGIPFQQLKQFAFSSVEALGTDAKPMDPGDAIKTIQVLNMLSSFKTPGRNLTGNTAFYVVDALAMDGAALLDTALAQLTGTRSVSRGGSPVDRAMWRGAAQSMNMAVLEAALDVDMARGETMYGTGGKRTFRSGTNFQGRERGSLGFVGRFLSAMERNQSYLLTVPDEFFKGMARTHQDRLQTLIDQGKIKTENANYAQEMAEQLAKYRTFQDDSAASVISTGIHDLLNLLPGFGDSGKRIKGLTVHSAGLGDFVSPFARVVANLASRVVDYNPVTAARGALEIGHILYDAQVGKKSIDPARQAKAVSRTARGLTGSALIGVFLMALSAGLIRRADDEGDDDVAQLNRSEGRTGQQWNLSAFARWIGGGNQKWQSGDKLLDISPLQPFNELLGVAEQIYQDEEKSVSSLLKDDLLGMMYAAAEMPVLKTAGDLGKDLFLYRKDPVDSIAQAAANTAVSSVTPNLMNSIAQGLDDRPRTIDRENGLWKLMQDTVKSRTPGLRQTLPGSVDPTGQDKTYPGSKIGHFVNSTLNPLGLNTYEQSEQSREWQRLREETGRTDFYPSASIPKKLEGTNPKTEEKVSKEMTYRERQEFQRQRGLYLMPAVMELMNHQSYQSYDADRQADLMDAARAFANDAAKAQALGSDYVDKWVNKTLEAQEKTGLSPGAVLIYRDLKNRGKGMDNEQVRQKIHEDPSLTVKQKNAMDDLLLTDGFWIPQDKDVDYSSDETFAVSQMSESAQKHWDLVRDRTGISTSDYQTAWSICNRKGTKAEPYREQDKIRDLADQLGISPAEARRIYSAIKTDIDQ